MFPTPDLSSDAHHETHQWRLIRETPNHSLYRRSLGDLELGFYWDSVFAGTANLINQITLDVEPSLENDLFSNQNVEKAWVRVKQRYPLLGASISESPDSATIEFVVDEESLRTHRPNEIIRIDVDDVGQIAAFGEELLNGNSRLSNDFLSRVWVVKQENMPGRYHVFICSMHCIMDAMANTTATREFLQELSMTSTDVRADSTALAERLRTLIPIEDLHPISGMSAARRRWRTCTAKVIANLRASKQFGGHTLPRHPLDDPGKPALSHMFLLRLPPEVSKRIIDSCRLLGITFGSALPVLSQVAISRVLHMRRRQTNDNGEPLISDDEWEFRRIQPMHFGGPVNFRPFLNREWFDHGGATDICLAISFSYSTLPFMPSCSYPIDTGEEINGAPHFRALLSSARFVHRARIVQAQIESQLRSPLNFELHAIQAHLRVPVTKAAGLAWREREQGRASAPPPSTFNNRSCVFTNGGSSLGNRDKMLPYEYPTHSAQKRLHIVDTRLYLRCRPAELYLGSLTEQGQLTFFAYVDMNAYEENTVQEWMEEIRDAAIHYLGHAVTGQRCKL